jgi:hypothetical protein
MATVHVIYNGESSDYPTDQLDIGPASTDVQVLDALANVAGIPRVKLNGFSVNTNEETGDITVSPRAPFGNT